MGDDIRHGAGLCIWFTGQPSAGKTTLANHLAPMIENLGRRVTLLDGDAVREHLSTGLGFSRPERDLNVMRVGWVAAQIVYHGGVAVCSLVSPYEDTRLKLAGLFDQRQFVLVHVSTPPDVCEQRDAKGMYAKARAGMLRGFTGVDDPYECPASAAIRIDTSAGTREVNAKKVLDFLVSEKKLQPGLTFPPG